MIFPELENKCTTENSIDSDRPNRSKSIKNYSHTEIDAINEAYDLQYEKSLRILETE